ncbi:glycosyltransferase family 2 protein [Piscinibacter sakaiensis]|uniref:Lipopolysaccharide core biosynthesis glycosyl transferase n=1 Tax=Piscinibacter sakaiensis TaxID=1547922 RepID=A0A0K8P232_PISS1|nr:glycosyltransferase family 2 protein [Piscinibacter sakaiensis]GAP36658.1 lipopolysaccharide core biosynthesis glycosyl transferase [Piscinibacter sakaiensis]
MPKPGSLTVVIVAKNEARNIADCIRSAAFADEVLVLDSGSHDDTVARAQAAGARVVQTDWPGYGPQVARGFGLATGEWVLSLDADERITEALRAEVQAAIRAGTHDGYRLPRLSEFCGRFIHHGGWRPDYTLRLGRRAKSGFTDHFLHAHMTVDGPVADLRSPLVHYSYPDLHDVLEKLDRYSSGHAKDMLARGRSGGLGKALLHGTMAFVRTYFLRLGLLDGQHGLMLAIYNAEYTYYKYLKLKFLQSPARRPEFPGR